MVRRGLGIGVMFLDVAERCPDVVRILPGLQKPPVPVWLTAHRELHTSRRVRLVYDHLDAALGQSVSPSSRATRQRRNMRND